MPRCPACWERIEGDRTLIGARCPHCRDPLYEKPTGPGAKYELEGTQCSMHASHRALGTCSRCGNYICFVCRTRWQGRTWCAACVERALDGKDAAPEMARMHFRQALLSSILGGLAWLITIFSAILIAVGYPDDWGLIFLGGMFIMCTPLPSLLGVGEGAAAVRERGDHMILASLGLFLSALHSGMFVGAFSMMIWVNW